jgi:hypothetical protein
MQAISEINSEARMKRGLEILESRNIHENTEDGFFAVPS